MNTKIPTNPSHPLVPVRPPAANTSASRTVEAIIAAMPDRSVGRRPMRSTIDSDTTVATSEPTCTSAGRSSSAVFPLKPMSLKISGL